MLPSTRTLCMFGQHTSLLRRLACAILLVLLGLALPSLGQDGERARCKLLYPPYAITADDAQYIVDPYYEGTWDGRMFTSKHSNGAESLDILRLTIHPGQGWHPHRHFEADEWLYVLSGTGGYAYWAIENVAPTELAIATGHALFNPQHQLHKVWNNGTEPLMLLAVSKSLAPYEVLADWPDSADGGVGFTPSVMPWELTCAPGHAPGDEAGGETDVFNDELANGAVVYNDRFDDEEGELIGGSGGIFWTGEGEFGGAFDDEEGGGGFTGLFSDEMGGFGDFIGEEVGGFGEFTGDEVGEFSLGQGELDAGVVEAGDEGDEYDPDSDYGDQEGCPCSGEPSNEDAIAECFAEPDDDLAAEMYGAEEYEEDDGDEGMGFFDLDGEHHSAHVADEL